MKSSEIKHFLFIILGYFFRSMYDVDAQHFIKEKHCKCSIMSLILYNLNLCLRFLKFGSERKAQQPTSNSPNFKNLLQTQESGDMNELLGLCSGRFIGKLKKIKFIFIKSKMGT
jgi:hypothetical protein